MRLPFLQVSQKFLTAQVPLIAALLRLDRRLVVGMGADLFSFTVEQTSSDDTPPDGIFADADAATILEGVMGWVGEPGKCVDAFVRAGVLEKEEAGLRVRGCDRYKAAWEKNKRRKRPTGEKPETMSPVTGENRTGTGEKPGGTGPVPVRQTYTQTHTQKQQEETSSAAAAAAPQQKASDAPEAKAPKKHRPTNGQAEFVEWAGGTRAEVLPQAPPDVKPNWGQHGPELTAMLRDHGRKAADAAYRLFLSDEYARGCDPPCPLPLFISRWPKWVSAATKVPGTGPPQSANRITDEQLKAQVFTRNGPVPNEF